jgi:hypothetical protein
VRVERRQVAVPGGDPQVLRQRLQPIRGLLQLLLVLLRLDGLFELRLADLARLVEARLEVLLGERDPGPLALEQLGALAQLVPKLADLVVGEALALLVLLVDELGHHDGEPLDERHRLAGHAALLVRVVLADVVEGLRQHLVRLVEAQQGVLARLGVGAGLVRVPVDVVLVHEAADLVEVLPVELDVLPEVLLLDLLFVFVRVLLLVAGELVRGSQGGLDGTGGPVAPSIERDALAGRGNGDELVGGLALGLGLARVAPAARCECNGQGEQDGCKTRRKRQERVPHRATSEFSRWVSATTGPW